MSTLQSYTDATRPSASANSGLCIFNTSSNTIEVSDGTSWLAYSSDGTTGNSLSLDFDGGDRLDTTYSMTSVQSFTVMWWMKSTNTNSYSCMLADQQTSTTYGNLSVLRPPAGNFYIRFQGVGVSAQNYKDDVTNFNSLCDGVWHHVAIVFDSSGTYTNVAIYKDGSLAQSEDARTANGWLNDYKVVGTSPDNFTFGSRDVSASPLFYVGKMDQMAFFESALTSTNISDIYNSGDGGDLLSLGFSPNAYYRVGYYSEDTNSDSSVALAGEDIGTVADYSGNNNDASQATASLKPNYVADTAF